MPLTSTLQSQRQSSRIIVNSQKLEKTKPISQENSSLKDTLVKKRGRPPAPKKIIQDDVSKSNKDSINKTMNQHFSKIPTISKNVEDSINNSKNQSKNILSVSEIQSTSNNIFNHLSDDCNEPEIIENPSNDFRKKKQESYTPIIITKQLRNPKETIKKIKEWTENTVHFRSVKDGISIITYSKHDYDLFITKLKEIKFEFYTFTHLNDRPKKLVLKGMSQDYELEEILQDLKSQSENKKINVLSINIIYRHIKNKDTNTIKRVPSNKYLVNLSSDSDLNYITNNVKYVCDHQISWEQYIKKFVATQCRRCQKFGHAAANCHNVYRCVKCTTIHNPGECPKLENEKPKCVNCQEEHSANYKKCSTFLEYTKRTQRIKTKVNERNNQEFMNFVKPNVSYREVLSGTVTKESNNKEDQPNDFFFMFNEIKNLFNISIEELMLKIKDFMPIYKNTTDQSTKMTLMISFLSQFV